MNPAPGDPSIRVIASHVAEGFRAVGAVAGDTVLYHGSLRSMGAVVGGVPTVIRGALEAVGPAGTIAVPTLWFHGATPPLAPEAFDVQTSPSYIGALSEQFRQDPRSIRSNDFSHSISAIGARAAELVADHEKSVPLLTPWSQHAFSPGSPWDRLYAWNALYCFIGVTMLVCTMKHYVEARLVAECLDQAAPERQPALRSGVKRIGLPGVWPFYDSERMERLLTERGCVRTGAIGAATVRGIRTRTLVDETSAVLRAAPQEWFKPEYLTWREDCLRR